MSTVFSPTPESLGLNPSSLAPKAGAYRTRRQFDGARGLAAMLLAAAVAALVVFADRLISTWADGHLFLAWVFLWVVIFAGSALFAGTARRLAQRTMRSLDGWSQTLAQARAEARLWDLAQSDPRLMADLTQARLRALEDHNDFSDALAPMGLVQSKYKQNQEQVPQTFQGFVSLTHRWIFVGWSAAIWIASPG